jgi:heptosyltransferase-2
MLGSWFFPVRLPTLLAILERERTERGIRRPGDPRRFLVCRLDSMGDVVMTTPLFRELKRAFPASHCTVVVREPYRPLLATNPHIDCILTLPPSEARGPAARLQNLLSVWRFRRSQLAHRTFDVALSPRWDMDEELATLLCVSSGARVRVGYTVQTSPEKARLNAGFDGALTLCLPAGPARHEVLRNLALVEALGGTVEDDRLEIHVTERDRAEATRLLAGVVPGRRLIALGIGAASRGRCWPPERYAELMLRLGRQRQIQPILLCSAEERALAGELAQQLPMPSILAAGLPLREVCAVLERCHLFVGNDSGCAHLAAAMNCRTVVISRHPISGDADHRNSPVRFAPYCRWSRVLQPSARDHCHAACGHSEPHCILGVSVDRVFTAATQMLGIEDAIILPEFRLPDGLRNTNWPPDILPKPVVSKRPQL